MTMLSDSTIKDMVATGHLGLDPYDPELVQPASVDIRLDRFFRTMFPDISVIDPADPADIMDEMVEIADGDSFWLPPNDFVLGSTLERVSVPLNLACRVEGKSSLGRIGLMIHSTAGWVDPGFNGYITLEISNVARVPILLHPGMLIGQLAFMYLDRPAAVPYGAVGRTSHYQGQKRGPQPAWSRVVPDGAPSVSRPLHPASVHAEQARPVPNDGPAIQDLVLNDIRDRKALGIQRYGTALQAHSGRDMLLDAYEEALDLAIYLRGALAERETAA